MIENVELRAVGSVQELAKAYAVLKHENSELRAERAKLQEKNAALCALPVTDANALTADQIEKAFDAGKKAGEEGIVQSEYLIGTTEEYVAFLGVLYGKTCRKLADTCIGGLNTTDRREGVKNAFIRGVALARAGAPEPDAGVPALGWLCFKHGLVDGPTKL